MTLAREKYFFLGDRGANDRQKENECERQRQAPETGVSKAINGINDRADGRRFIKIIKINQSQQGQNNRQPPRRNESKKQ